jgi:hypothetical protein
MPWKADGSRKKSPLYKKSGFKMGSAQRYDASYNARTPNKPLGFTSGTDVNVTPLSDGVIAEANMDGSMSIDPSIPLNSPLGKRAIKHEQKHLEQISSGRAAYDDNVVMWEGKMYLRKNINGEKVIDGPNGRWPEGNANHPWEAEAIAAEKINNNNKG